MSLLKVLGRLTVAVCMLLSLKPWQSVCACRPAHQPDGISTGSDAQKFLPKLLPGHSPPPPFLGTLEREV